MKSYTKSGLALITALLLSMASGAYAVEVEEASTAGLLAQHELQSKATYDESLAVGTEERRTQADKELMVVGGETATAYK